MLKLLQKMSRQQRGPESTGREPAGAKQKIRTRLWQAVLGLAIAGAVMPDHAEAQIQPPVAAYSFAASSGSFTPIAGGTVVSSIHDDEKISAAINIGFTFNYGGVDYTQVRASSNGFLSFNSSSGSEYSNTLSGAPASARPLVAPLWDDLDGRATGGVSKASYETTGAAGSRVFTFEWLNWEWNYSSASPVISFQVKLYEGSNKIEFIYQPESGNVSSGSASIGLAGTGSGSGSYLSLNNAGANPTASSTTNTTTISAKPAAGQVYTFMPPQVELQAVAVVLPQQCGSANSTISVQVKNNGLSPYDFAAEPLTINLTAAGPNPASFPAVTVNTGTLAPGASQAFTVTTAYDMTASGSYSFTGSISSPADVYTGNNSFPSASTTVRTAVTNMSQKLNFTGFTGANLSTLYPEWYEAKGVAPSGTTSDWLNRTGLGGASNVTAKINLWSTSKRDWIISPVFVVNPTDSLFFKVAVTDYNSTNPDPAGMAGTDDMVQVMISTNCGATWTPLMTFDATSNLTNVLTEKKIPLAQYAGQKVTIGFYATDGTVSDTPDYDFHLDDIFVGTAPPVDVAATALVSPAPAGCYTSSNNVVVEIKNVGTSLIDFSTDSVVVTVNVTGAATQTFTTTIKTGTLGINASQQVTVGTLDMSAPGVYTLNASAVSPNDLNAANNVLPAESRTVRANAALPLAVNFTGFTGSNLTTVFPEWYEAAGTTPAGTTSVWIDQTGVGGSGNKTARINLYTNTRHEWIVGPKFVPGPLDVLTFKAAVTDWNSTTAADAMGSDDKVQVMVSADCGATWTPIYTMNAASGLTTTLQEQTVFLQQFQGQEIILAFYATDGPVDDPEDYDFHIDDINISTAPAFDLGVAALSAPVQKVCYSAAEPVSVTIRNFSPAALNFAADSATVTVQVTGAVTQTFTAVLDTGALAGGASMTVPVGTLDMSAPGSYSFKAFTTFTSGATDGKAANDTTAAVRTVSALTAGTAKASVTAVCFSGTSSISLTGHAGGEIQWQQSASGAAGSFTNIAGATAATYVLPAAISQNLYFRAIVSCGTNADTSNVASVVVNNPQIPAAADVTRCGPGMVSLSAAPSAGADIVWYSAATGGNQVATGATFTPNVTATTTYYAASVFQSNELVGKKNSILTDGTYGGSSTGLVFSATNPVVLNSVVVFYSGSAAPVTINLQNSSGTVLQTTTFTLPAASSVTPVTIPLNFNVPAGTGLRLVQSTSVAMYRDFSGNSFPYTSPSGVVTITGGYLSGASTTYYYFYDWDITTQCASARKAVVANVTPLPAASVTAVTDTVFCASGSLSLKAPSQAGVAYQWLLNGAAIAGATDSVYSAAVTASGMYSVRVTSNTTGCLDISAPVQVVVNPLPATAVTASGATTFCQGDSVTLSAPVAAGHSYQWKLNGSAVAGATSPDLTVTVAGSYSVVITSAAGCTDSSAATVVTINPRPATPTIQASGATTFCEGDSVVLTVQLLTGHTYQWLNNGVAIPGAVNPDYFTNSAGSYAVVVTNASGCSDTSSAISVFVEPKPAAPVISFNPANGQLSANGGGVVQWYLNGQPVSGANGNTFMPSQPGSYSAMITNASGCNSDISASVNVTLLGVKDALAAGASVSVYPNPNHGQLQVLLQGFAQDVELVLYNVVGQPVYKEKIKASGADVNQKLNLSHLPAGVYMLHSRSGNQASYIKVIKE